MKHLYVRSACVVAAIGALLYAVPTQALSVPRRIDGLPVAPGAQNPWIVGAMIDNSPAARPQAGLGVASVVYETLAEGGVPRFLALYARRALPRVGPIRSVRPYFADLAAEYQAAVAHAGGSTDGLRALDRDHLRSINALRGPSARTFFRLAGYAPTHNLFTNGTLLQRELKRVNLWNRAPGYQGWRFAADPPLSQRPKHGASLSIDFHSGSAYTVGYTYNRVRNAFERSTGGRPHRDGPGGSVLAPKNVLVLFVPKERVLDRAGRLAISVLGSGKGILLKNGKAMTVRWKKTAPSHRTQLTTLSGAPIALTRGSTWIEIVPRGKSVRVR